MSEDTENLFVEKEITSKIMCYNDDKILAVISKYLEENQIDGESYRAEKIEFDKHLNGFTVYLKKDSNEEIDEDFDSDSQWDQFCEELAARLRVRFFGVPYYYYPK